MNECSAGFELGTPPAQITTADPGDATPFDYRNLAPDNASLYDTTHAIGSQSCKMSSGGSGGGNALGWEYPGALGSLLTDFYWRAYVYFEDRAAYAISLCECIEESVNQFTNGRVVIQADGSIQVYNAAGPQLTFTEVLPLDQWVRFEGHVLHSTGHHEVRLFLDAASDTPDETHDVANGISRASAYRWSCGFAGLNMTFWLDQIVTGASDWVGPVPGQPATPARFAGPLQLGTSPATLFTSTGRSLIEMIHLSNPSGSPVDFSLSIGADSAGTRLYDGYSIPADTERKFRQLFVLEDGEVIQAFAGTDAVLDISVDGRVL